MPSLGADMEAGTLVEWLKKPGDPVRRGDIVAVVETEKGAIEIEVFETGVLERYLVNVGVEVPVGAPLAMIRGPGEAAGAPIAKRAVTPPTPAPAPAIGERPPPSPEPLAAPQPALPRVRATPAARRAAQARGLDLVAVKGTGPDGVIVLADVEAAVGKPAIARPPGAFNLDQMRAAIAAAMAHSKREIPHYYLANSVDVGRAADWVAATNAERPPDRRLLLGALFVKATALALKAFPEFNGRYERGAFAPSPAVHAGIAISIRGGGLVAPAIHDAADLPLDELMAKMRDLVGRVRTGRFRSSEIADPTVTVSSLGDRGVETLYGVIYPPQVAIVGFGKLVRRAWAVDEDALAVRPVVTTTLAADHRVSDGHRGALFLARIGDLLQRPEAL